MTVNSPDAFEIVEIRLASIKEDLQDADFETASKLLKFHLYMAAIRIIGEVGSYPEIRITAFFDEDDRTGDVMVDYNERRLNFSLSETTGKWRVARVTCKMAVSGVREELGDIRPDLKWLLGIPLS